MSDRMDTTAGSFGAVAGRGTGPTAKDIAAMIGAAHAPTAEQQRIIESPTRPLLVVAGAGSGKTETMSQRVLWLVANQGIPASSILGLTFTRKAAGELGTRLRERLERLRGTAPEGGQWDEPIASTYNSFAEGIVREHGLRIGLDPDVRLLGQAAAVQMVTDIVQSYPKVLIPDAATSTIVKQVLSMAGNIAEHDLDVPRARRELQIFAEDLGDFGSGNDVTRKGLAANERRIALLELVSAYEARKRAAGVIDFSDQLALATRIVRDVPDVVAQLRSEYRAVLLDEFQDTSVIQMELLSAIFHDHPVTAVGDPNQAIYGWRGASAASLESFHARFQPGIPPEPEQTLTLSTSWRNDEAILAVSNLIAQPLRDVAQNAESPVLEARPGAGEGAVAVEYAHDRRSQADAVARFIAAHRGKTVRDGKAVARTAAVLCRRRRDFGIVEEVLREHDIPTQIIGLGGLLDQPAVQDVRAALELTVDGANSPWAMRLLAGLDLGPSDLRALSQWADHLADRGSGVAERPPSLLAEAIDTPPKAGWRRDADSPAITEAAVRRLSILGRKLRAVRAGVGGGIVEQIERTMMVLGTFDDAEADPLGNGGTEALNYFVDIADSYESETPDPTMRGFLAWLAVAEEEERGLAGPASEPDPAAVQIMTVHGSKGLEWDAVAVFGMGESAFPSHGSYVPPASLMELDRWTPERWEGPKDATSGWWGDASELPHPIRGDADSLPAFHPEPDPDKRTPAAAFKAWFEGDYKPRLGAHAVLEERRLAYVAFTRARSALLLAGSWIDTGRRLRNVSRFIVEPLRAGLIPDEATTIAKVPDEDEIAAALAGQVETYPPQPGRSRELVTAAAGRVAERRRVLDASGLDAEAALHAIVDTSDVPAVRDMAVDALALLREERLRRAGGSQVISSGRVPATRVPGLIDDPAEYALDLRRPIPSEPSDSASMGTILHAWIERRLRHGAALPDVDVDGSDIDGGAGAGGGAEANGYSGAGLVPGEDVLSPDSRERMDTIRTRDFDALGHGDVPFLDMEVVALEEPFSLSVAGISVQGRIDAVFRDADGRIIIIDWKSGKMPTGRHAEERRRQHAIQLHLYRLAWGEQHGIRPADIDCRIAYLSDPIMASIDQLAPGMDDDALEAGIRAAFGNAVG